MWWWVARVYIWIWINQWNRQQRQWICTHANEFFSLHNLHIFIFSALVLFLYMYIYSADMLVIYTNVCILHPPKHRVYVDSPSLSPHFLLPATQMNHQDVYGHRRRTD